MPIVLKVEVTASILIAPCLVLERLKVAVIDQRRSETIVLGAGMGCLIGFAVHLRALSINTSIWPPKPLLLHQNSVQVKKMSKVLRDNMNS